MLALLLKTVNPHLRPLLDGSILRAKTKLIRVVNVAVRYIVPLLTLVRMDIDCMYAEELHPPPARWLEFPYLQRIIDALAAHI